MYSVAMKFPVAAIGKGRPRVGRNGIVYTPKTTAEFERFIKAQAKIIMAGEKPFPATDALRVEIRYIYEMPKSWAKWKKDLASVWFIPKITKPDIDNADKAILDALNGVVWEDDKCIYKLTSMKVWGHSDMIEVVVFSSDPWKALRMSSR